MTTSVISSFASTKTSAIIQTAFERWAFAAFLFFLPFQTRFLLADMGSGNAVGEWTKLWLWLSDLAFFFLITAWFTRKLERRDLKPLLFLAFFIPSFAANPSALGAWTILKIGEGLLLFSYTRRHRQWFLTTALWPYAFLIGIVANALAGIVQFALQHDIGLQTLDESPLGPDLAGVAKLVVANAVVIRAYGITPHPNILGPVLLAGIAVVTFLYILRGVKRLSSYSAQRQREELVRGSLLFAFLFGLLLTFSRTSWIGVAIFIVAVTLVVLWRETLRRPYVWETIRFFILFGAIVAMLVVAFWPFVQARTDPASTMQAIELRTFTGQEAARMIADHPITGVGPGRFVQELAQRYPELPAWQMQPVHNVVLLLAAENGVPATFSMLTAFVFLFLTTWRRVMRMHDPGVQIASLCLLAFTTGLLALSLGDHLLLTSQQGRLILWFTLGLLAA